MRRWTIPVLVATVALVLAACAPAASPSPQPTVRPLPSLPPLVVTPAPDPAATETPVVSLTPTPGPVACAVSPLSTRIPSDRLSRITIEVDITVDRVNFHFLPGHRTRPQGPASLEIATTKPPFYEGQSTGTVEVAGDRYIMARFSGMTVEDFEGPIDLTPAAPSLAEVFLSDASEGILAFVVGYDGLPCPTVEVISDELVTIEIPH